MIVARFVVVVVVQRSNATFESKKAYPLHLTKAAFSTQDKVLSEDRPGVLLEGRFIEGRSNRSLSLSLYPLDLVMELRHAKGLFLAFWRLPSNTPLPIGTMV